jgi:hypothetical protein
VNLTNEVYIFMRAYVSDTTFTTRNEELNRELDQFIEEYSLIKLTHEECKIAFLFHTPCIVWL